MGKPGRVDDPEVQSAIRRVEQAAAQAEMPLGIFTTSPEAGRRYLEGGYAFAGVGVDAMLLAVAARSVVRQVKGD
jgi:2-keto-3-deoxy-L-rhamnonate aldolase RhmA